MKYDDSMQLLNPLRARKGYTDKQMFTVREMQSAHRFPMPDPIVNVPEDFTLYIDSLMINGYSPEELDEWCGKPQRLRQPNNSDASLEEISFGSSSDQDDDEMIPKPETKL